MTEDRQIEERQAKIYAAYRDKVLSYLTGKTANREDAEDLCAQVFEKVCRALPGYDETRASLSTWIYTITRNTLADFYRTRHPVEPLRESIPAPDDLEERFIKEETLARLTALLNGMRRQERDIIVLRYYKGYSLTYIAQLTGMNYGTVKAAHHRALKKLRQSLALP